MKKINLHLIAFVIVLISVITFNWQYGNETFLFYGFAENKEMEIRIESPVSIESIKVSPGAKVNAGDLLLEVTRSGLELAQSDLNHEVAKLESQYMIWKADIKSSINQLIGQKNAKEREIQSQIEQLESEMAINRSLIKDLESVQPAKDGGGRSPNEIKIEGLKNELRLSINPIKAEIMKLRNELNAPGNPLRIQIEKLKEELGFVYKEEEKQKIFATNDGIVGSIFCKIGEQFSGFSTLMTFYEENPTQVKGYVLESLILKVHVGDEIEVNSGGHSNYKCMGKVVGMGSRIVEIPERLRKNPIFKTYGREIIIEIPSNNSFLQKEKVILKLPSKNGDSYHEKIKAFTVPKTSEVIVFENNNDWIN